MYLSLKIEALLFEAISRKWGEKKLLKVYQGELFSVSDLVCGGGDCLPRNCEIFIHEEYFGQSADWTVLSSANAK
jgi:hypothetical protein